MSTRLILNGGTQNWRWAGNRTIDEARRLIKQAMESGQVIEVPIDLGDGTAVEMLLNGAALSTAVLVDIPDSAPNGPK